MTMSIRTNVGSLNAQRNLFGTQNELSSTLSKLSSGYRITKAGDDAAGLAISETLRSQISGLNQAARNANDAISMIQTAEGAMQEVHTMLQRMSQLSVQAANGTLSNSNRQNIDTELTELTAEINAIAQRSTFNGIELLNGEDRTFQIGATSTDTLTVEFAELDIGAAAEFADLNTALTGFTTAAAATDEAAAITAAGTLLDEVNNAIDLISAHRAKLGASQNRLEHTIANLNVTAENLSASESRIRDADVAEETAAMSRAQILMQAGVSVLAQANQMPQVALKLLG
ncbi:flagellin [Vulgatibacter sp.]|uniref:flagellin N-terminal helical domain-containing protein n=1 Tax=Vulgatibacter sp. TaxID=1971226 RepID=UPI0035685E13